MTIRRHIDALAEPKETRITLKLATLFALIAMVLGWGAYAGGQAVQLRNAQTQLETAKKDSDLVLVEVKALRADVQRFHDEFMQFKIEQASAHGRLEGSATATR